MFSAALVIILIIGTLTLVLHTVLQLQLSAFSSAKPILIIWKWQSGQKKIVQPNVVIPGQRSGPKETKKTKTRTYCLNPLRSYVITVESEVGKAWKMVFSLWSLWFCCSRGHHCSSDAFFHRCFPQFGQYRRLGAITPSCSPNQLTPHLSLSLPLSPSFSPSLPLCLSLFCLQLHNEDDSSEASASEQQQQQPCTSASAQSSGQDPGQVQAQASSSPAAAALREAEVPPPPYASIDLGAGASAGATAAPGVCILRHFQWNRSYQKKLFIRDC